MRGRRGPSRSAAALCATARTPAAPVRWASLSAVRERLVFIGTRLVTTSLAPAPAAERCRARPPSAERPPPSLALARVDFAWRRSTKATCC